MKIAISATDSNLNAKVDPRFGRCQYFVIVDPETMEFKSIKNAGILQRKKKNPLYCKPA